jgi:hypothetical protein
MTEATTTHVYELRNMSDPYTLVCDDDTLAAVAAICLGEGAYLLFRDGHEGSVAPLLMFGGEKELDDWCASKGIVALDEYIKSHAEALAATLGSVLIGDRKDRQVFEEMTQLMSSDRDRERARSVWHERKRTSMNDIGARAYAMAKHLRKRESHTAASTT